MNTEMTSVIFVLVMCPCLSCLIADCFISMRTTLIVPISTSHTTCQILDCVCQLTSIFFFGVQVFVHQMSKTCNFFSKIHTPCAMSIKVTCKANSYKMDSVVDG